MRVLKYLFLFLLSLVTFFFPYNTLLFTLLLLFSLILYPQLFSKIQLIHSPNSSLLPILFKCPSLHLPYRPPLYLFNGFTQGFFGMTLGSRPGQSIFCDSVEYSRKLLSLPDGGLISIDWHIVNDCKTILVVAAGLGSNSQSQSTRSVTMEAEKYGMSVAVIHGRGVFCDLKTPMIFNLCVWEDYAFAIEYIHKEHPKAPLIGLGMSMGGAILTNYACRTGDSCLLQALAVVAAPLNSGVSVEKLISQWNFLGFFDQLILMVLKGIAKNLEKDFEQFKEELQAKGVNYPYIYEATNCAEFDDRLTAKLLGLENAQGYYEKSSCGHLLKDLRIPYLAMHAKDDPIVSYLAVPLEEFRVRDNIVLVLTTTGGHVGFFRGLFPPKRWFQVPCLEFLSGCISQSHKYG